MHGWVNCRLWAARSVKWEKAAITNMWACVCRNENMARSLTQMIIKSLHCQRAVLCAQHVKCIWFMASESRSSSVNREKSAARTGCHRRNDLKSSSRGLRSTSSRWFTFIIRMVIDWNEGIYEIMSLTSEGRSNHNHWDGCAEGQVEKNVILFVSYKPFILFSLAFYLDYSINSLSVAWGPQTHLWTNCFHVKKTLLLFIIVY